MAIRSGGTERITISLDKAEAAAMKRRAKRLHAGNLSAAFAELAHRVLKEEALDRALAQLPPSTPKGRAQVRAELAAPLPPPPKRMKRRRAA